MIKNFPFSVQNWLQFRWYWDAPERHQDMLMFYMSGRNDVCSSSSPLDVQPDTKAAARLFSLAFLVYLIVWAAGFGFASREFGLGAATVLSSIPALPLIVGLRMRRRWHSVQSKELVLLALLLVVAIGSSLVVVRNWYETGMDRYHSEDVKFVEFGRALRKDPAFQDIRICFTKTKHIYWVSGTVKSESDLSRLRFLAARYGITGRLDGPFEDSISITIRQQQKLERKR